eukprot:TRINITY_DN3300_c1_g1_i1.p1 TRINITY_DN3300_c1_g1~~TRINITY_DN3300_c1_g1_i1.p1  ORF type:complete len:952 (+),score=221.25 TRINITY_DN3300_c1_g1_i1:70-2856(+)
MASLWCPGPYSDALPPPQPPAGSPRRALESPPYPPSCGGTLPPPPQPGAGGCDRAAQSPAVERPTVPPPRRVPSQPQLRQRREPQQAAPQQQGQQHAAQRLISPAVGHLSAGDAAPAPALRSPARPLGAPPVSASPPAALAAQHSRAASLAAPIFAPSRRVLEEEAAPPDETSAPSSSNLYQHGDPGQPDPSVSSLSAAAGAPEAAAAHQQPPAAPAAPTGSALQQQEAAQELAQLRGELDSQGRLLAAALGRQRERATRREEFLARTRGAAVAALSSSHARLLLRAYYGRLRSWAAGRPHGTPRHHRRSTGQRGAWRGPGQQAEAPVAPQWQRLADEAARSNELRRELQAARRGERSLRKVCTVLQRSLADAVAERDSLRSRFKLLPPEARAFIITQHDPPPPGTDAARWAEATAAERPRGLSASPPPPPPQPPPPPVESADDLAQRLWMCMRGTQGADEAGVLAVLYKLVSADQWAQLQSAFRSRRPSFYGGEVGDALRGELSRRGLIEACRCLNRLGAPLDRDGAGRNSPLPSPASRRRRPRPPQQQSAAVAQAEESSLEHSLHSPSPPHRPPSSASGERGAEPELAAEPPPPPPPPRRPSQPKARRPAAAAPGGGTPRQCAHSPGGRTPRRRGPDCAAHTLKVPLQTWAVPPGLEFRLEGDQAVLSRVEPGSPAAAARAGRFIGRIVTHCNSRRIQGTTELRVLVSAAAKNSPCTLSLRFAPPRAALASAPAAAAADANKADTPAAAGDAAAEAADGDAPPAAAAGGACGRESAERQGAGSGAAAPPSPSPAPNGGVRGGPLLTSPPRPAQLPPAWPPADAPAAPPPRPVPPAAAGGGGRQLRCRDSAGAEVCISAQRGTVTHSVAGAARGPTTCVVLDTAAPAYIQFLGSGEVQLAADTDLEQFSSELRALVDEAGIRASIPE